jgi:hypothetical protein
MTAGMLEEKLVMWPMHVALAASCLSFVISVVQAARRRWMPRRRGPERTKRVASLCDFVGSVRDNEVNGDAAHPRLTSN